MAMIGVVLFFIAVAIIAVNTPKDMFRTARIRVTSYVVAASQRAYEMAVTAFADVFIHQRSPFNVPSLDAMREWFVNAFSSFIKSMWIRMVYFGAFVIDFFSGLLVPFSL